MRILPQSLGRLEARDRPECRSSSFPQRTSFNELVPHIPSVARLLDCGLGLTSANERFKLVKGEFVIDSQLGRGTTIHARVRCLWQMPTSHHMSFCWTERVISNLL